MKKIREALVKARKAICHHAEHVCQSLAWENSTINANCGDVLCAHRDLCEAKTAIDNAISSPERNCDLEECSTDDGVIFAHKRFCESWHSDGKTCAECPYNTLTPLMTCREKWLLAPAVCA